MEILGVIAARKGSKGLPNKHKYLLNGKYLISYIIEECLRSKLLTKIVLSTDDEELQNIAENYKINFIKRPAELATDDSPIEEALHHTLEVIYKNKLPDIVVLFQGNIPHRKEGMIDKVINELISDDKADSAVSMYCPDPHLYSLKSITKQNMIVPVFSNREIFRRQDAERYFIIDGAISAIKSKVLMATKGKKGMHFYLGDNIRGVEQEKEYGIEVDSIEDIKLVNYYMKNSF